MTTLTYTKTNLRVAVAANNFCARFDATLAAVVTSGTNVIQNSPLSRQARVVPKPTRRRAVSITSGWQSQVRVKRALTVRMQAKPARVNAMLVRLTLLFFSLIEMA